MFWYRVDVKDIDKFIETVKALPYGGINLKTLKLLSHSEIERRLVEELDIP
jgi:malic enzyme